MYIESNLAKKTEQDFEKQLYPKFFNAFSELSEKFKSNTQIVIGDLTVTLGHIQEKISKEDELENKNIYETIRLLEENRELSSKDILAIRSLKKSLEINNNFYLNINDKDGIGYIFYEKDTVFHCLKTYPEFVASENDILNLSIDEYTNLTNALGRKYRNFSDDNYRSHPNKPTLKYMTNHMSLEDSYLSVDYLMKFEKERVSFININDSVIEFKNKFISNIKELNNSINLFNKISSELLENYKNIPENFVLNTYNKNILDLKNPLAENIKLKFNQIYNIMEDRFKGVREDFSDLNNHISVVKLEKMPNSRAIFMETQGRNLIAIEMDNSEIFIYRMAEENSIESLEFDFQWDTKNGINEKKLLDKSTRFGEIADELSNDNPVYLSLDFFLQKFDGSQHPPLNYSTEDNFEFGNITDENMAYVLLTNCQRFLCYNQNIDFDNHKDVDTFSLEYLINKNMNLYDSENKANVLKDILWSCYSNDFYKGKLEHGEGTDIPFPYKEIKSEDKDFYISWYSFTSTDLAKKIPDDINQDLLLGIKECLDNVKEYYNNKPEKIENMEAYEKTISSVEENISLIEKNKQKISKKIRRRM